MDPKDVNRINYNNYYVGQNLDFLVRSKMRSESLSTPLKNTPAFYDDQVTSKMSLLGKRGFYDPGYIYGFQNNENDEFQKNKNALNDEYTNPITREQYDQLILPKEHQREQELQNYENNQINNNNINMNPYGYNKNNNINNNKNEDEMMYKEKLELIKERERQTPQRLDNFQLNRINENKNININNNMNNNINNMNEIGSEIRPNYHIYNNEKMENKNENIEQYYEQMKYDNNMVRNRDKIPNLDYYQQINEYNYMNDLAQKNVGDLVLPPTKNQILQEVYKENFNRKNSPK